MNQPKQIDPERLTPEQYVVWKDGYNRGVKAAAGFTEPWDSTFAPLTKGYRFSDIILCKFNLVRLKRPRKVQS